MANVIIITSPYSSTSKRIHHELETVWTIIPGFILLFLALPSLRILYLLDRSSDPSIIIKTIGHQWYWSYDYADFINISFDSYITPTDDLLPGDIRLLETDNRLVLPIHLETSIIITAADVLHSWTIPNMGVKADAIPGRLNQISIIPSHPGVHYGQCSEICGANHSFMPITIEVISVKDWAHWTKIFK